MNLTKNDLKAIKSIVDTSIEPVMKDISSLKTETLGIRDKLDELYKFVVPAIGELLEWSDDILRSIVKKKLPERVERLEKQTGLHRLVD